MQRFSNSQFWFCLFGVNLLLRVMTLWIPFLDVDESQFAGFAHVLMEGGKPYLDSLDTKPLGIYLYYAFCFLIFGKHAMWGVHLMTALVQFLAALGICKIFETYGQALRGRWAALFYIVFSTTFVPKYLGTSINSVMVVFLVWSVVMVVKGKDFWGGLILGLAFLFKYTGGIQTVHFFILICGLAWQQRSWWLFWRRNVTFGLAFVLPFVAHSLALYQIGVWDDFWLWSVEGSGRYITAGGQTVSFVKSFGIRFGGYVLSTLAIWILAVRGLKYKDSDLAGKISLRAVFFWWFVCSLVPVCMGWRFYPHYFIQLLPALCGLAALGLSQFEWRWKSALTFGILFPAIVFWGLRVDHKALLEKIPDDQLYEQQEIGKRVKELSEPEDKIFVWGFATAIYFFSERQASSRFLWSDWLTGRVPGPKYGRSGAIDESDYEFTEAWEFFWQDMQTHKPRFFVDTAPGDIHSYGKFPISKYPKLQSFLAENFDLVEILHGVKIYKRKGN